MKKIKFIIPYFGKLPDNFRLWLLSCKTNASINWLIITDDRTKYNYPENVEVIYESFENLKNRIQENYDFPILIDRPWKLCDYKVSYGEIFEKELEGYDFWGHCDMDLMWGDIRKFITDEILDKYDKIGFQGHATIYRNNKEVNARYRKKIEGLPTYQEIFTNSKGYCFDEGGIGKIYDHENIPFYNKTNFIHLSKYDYGFVMEHIPKEEFYKNKRQIFIWEKGKIYRLYVYEKEIFKEEFMYIHFFCRPMSYKMKKYDENIKYVFYPDVAKELKDEITVKYIENKGKPSKIKYYFKSIYFNRKKITLKKIYENVQRMIKYKRGLNNEKK